MPCALLSGGGLAWRERLVSLFGLEAEFARRQSYLPLDSLPMLVVWGALQVLIGARGLCKVLGGLSCELCVELVPDALAMGAIANPKRCRSVARWSCAAT